MSSLSKSTSKSKKKVELVLAPDAGRKQLKSAVYSGCVASPRVVVVDDHDVILSAVSHAHHQAFGSAPHAQYNNLEELRKMLSSTGADIVILDLMLGEEDVRPHIPKLIDSFPKTRFLILSGLASSKQIAQVIRLGVHGFVHKSHGIDTIALAIQEIALRGKFLCSRATAALMEAMQGDQKGEETDSKLTKRELELLGVLARGHNIKLAAEKLGICEKTAYTHRAALLRKTGTSDNVGLVCYAIRTGLVEVPGQSS